MSNEDSIVPIKLAQRFIHIIDFHADPVTCVSASSGTVSYDSIQSPRHGRSDILLQQDAIHCIRQPPRPHHVSKLRKVFKSELLVKPTPVNIEEFRAIKKYLNIEFLIQLFPNFREHIYRKYGVSNVSKAVNDFGEVTKEVDLAMKECLVNFKKSEKDPTKKGIFNITVELPSSIPVPVNKPKEKFVISQRTLSPSLSTRITDAHGSQLDGHQQIEVAFKMCPDKSE
ncbi:hypothetical protein CAEBREN_00704 [Caenorhabditis brenneri]|uniref:Uncharacterized protein n=1 Tax=Caenorhabditis brenneri TaxID=135651 RepID=G0ML23_CAEBE|nr:hypothetical protein CAEBREN_00704 [Caenorhabditis brenneri]